MAREIPRSQKGLPDFKNHLKINGLNTTGKHGTRQANLSRIRTRRSCGENQATMKSNPQVINGLDTAALQGAITAIGNDADQGQTAWKVTTEWKGGTRSDTRVTGYQIAGTRVARDFTIPIDEPLELGGTNLHANPQEYQMAAQNACRTVGYTALCALQGIKLEELRIETEGEIDLRGFFGLDPAVKPGYEKLLYTVHLKGDGTPEQFEKIHRTVMATSPNYFHLASAIPLQSRLVIGNAAVLQPA